MNREKIVRLLLWLAIVAGCALRIYYVYHYNPVFSLWSDPARHWHNGTQPLDTSPVTLANPIGYQLWIGLVAKLTLGKPPLTFLYAAAMAVLAPWVWYRFFRELLSSRTLALAGWAVLVWLPSWFGIFALFMGETLFLPLLGAAFWMTWRCLRKRTQEAFVTMGVVWMLAGLTRGTAIPMAAVAAAWVWWGQPQRWRAALVFVAVLAPVLAFLGYRSYVASGVIAPVGDGAYDYVYSRSGRRIVVLNYTFEGNPAYNYWFGSPSMGKPPLQPLSNWESKRSGEQHVTVELTNPKPDWAVARKNARETGGAWLPWAFDGMVYLFFAQSWPDDNVERGSDRLAIAMRWIWAPLIFAGAVGLLLVATREPMRAGLLVSVFGAWLLVQGFLPIAVNEGRYRKPAEGWAIAAALVLIDRRVARKLALAGSAAVAVPAAAPMSASKEEAHPRSSEHNPR